MAAQSGLAATTLADKWLDMLSGSAFTAPTNVYAKLHTGEPGAAGTSNASAVTTRVVIAWSASSGASKAITTTYPSWSMTTGETITNISVWDNISTGNFLFSAVLTTPRAVINGDTLTLNSLTVALTPLATSS